ncbi:MAG TPA: hypothetical protein PKZ32_13545 [Candidatus Melainabacteria bacterium]|nr:hypothetical protein [Candidatus Melainabacteria bacterium]
MANKKSILIKTLAAFYLVMLLIAAGFMFEWMFKLPTIKYNDFAKYYTMAKSSLLMRATNFTTASIS